MSRRPAKSWACQAIPLCRCKAARGGGGSEACLNAPGASPIGRTVWIRRSRMRSSYRPRISGLVCSFPYDHRPTHFMARSIPCKARDGMRARHADQMSQRGDNAAVDQGGDARARRTRVGSGRAPQSDRANPLQALRRAPYYPAEIAPDKRHDQTARSNVATAASRTCCKATTCDPTKNWTPPCIDASGFTTNSTRHPSRAVRRRSRDEVPALNLFRKQPYKLAGSDR